MSRGENDPPNLEEELLNISGQSAKNTCPRSVKHQVPSDGQEALGKMDARLWTCHVAGRCLSPHVGKTRFVDFFFSGTCINSVSKPYRASGAAMAIEDAAVLGNLLSRISHISQLRSLLQAYQDLRLERTAAVQRASRADQMKKPTAPGSIGNRAELQWAQPVANQKPGDNKVHDEKLLSYDADAEVDKWWASHGKGVEALV